MLLWQSSSYLLSLLEAKQKGKLQRIIRRSKDCTHSSFSFQFSAANKENSESGAERVLVKTQASPPPPCPFPMVKNSCLCIRKT